MGYDCVCDYDPPEFWNKAMRKAAKPHKCYECGGTIQRGETHEYVSGKWEGCFNDFRTCSRCVELREWLSQFSCFCWAHGSMLDDAEEYTKDVMYRARAAKMPDAGGIRAGFLRRKILIRRHKSSATAA